MHRAFLKTIRRSIIGLAAAATLLGAQGYVAAQVVGDPIEVGNSCSYFGKDFDGSVYTFAAVSEAEEAIQAIVETAGLVPRFTTRAAGVPGAVAAIEGDQRLVLYEPGFMTDVREAVDSRWGPISILAHEIGHHLNGHTLEAGGSRPAIELEADYFSGFILQKMGASLEEAQLAMRMIGSEVASDTHPAKRDRLAAIGAGWGKACETDPNCVGDFAEDPQTVSLPGPNSCQYANDGECDEPTFCLLNTDSSDCRGVSLRPAEGNFDTIRLTNACETDDVKVALMFKDAASDEWKTTYWHHIKFGEQTPAFYSTNRYWFYYAESLRDGGTWNSIDDEYAETLTLKERTYHLGRKDSGTEWRDFNERLTCP